MKSTILVSALVVAFQLTAPCVGFAPSNTLRLSPTLAFHPLGSKFGSASHQRPLIFRHQPVWMTDSDESDEDDGEIEEVAKISEEEISRIQKFKKMLFPLKPDDGLTFRQRLAKAGLSVALSYGWVSNVSYSVTVSLAWFIFSKRSGLSPLAPGQWKNFLAVYAGFFVFNNIVRPLRFALSVGVSSQFDKVIKFIQEKFKVSKGVAIGLTVFLANIVGTIALMCAGISLAALAAGVPVFPPKP
jgi:hypothetical protein